MRGDSGPQGVVPLRNILRNFLNLVESCEASVKDGPDLYEKEFQELKQFSENLKSDPAYLCKEGEKNVNRKKNRYKDILPFDYTRVILGDYGDVPGSDYINANFIKGASGSSAYIACQGPLPHTVNDFWRMVVECEVQVIVMACNEQESGKHKCENYWVEDESGEREFGQVSVWLKKCRQVCPDFLVRTMRIRYTNTKGESEERNVCQFHYSAWPDHGVPTKVRPLLDMVRLIRDCQTSETLPVLVHCSAGCGRTGTICAIDYVWGLLRLGKLTPDFSLFCLVREMRRQRIAMVQTKDQYVLVHRAVKELFDEQLKIIDSHPYANVDLNGLPLDIKSDLEEPMYETVEFHSNESISPSVFYQSVASSPVLPTDNVSKVKISPDLEIHGNHKQPEITITSPVGGPLPPPTALQSPDDIIVLSSDNEDTTDKNKESLSPIAISNTKTSPSKTSLLRKPSIVKLKAFFEKSKDDKKGRSTQLSRAKSDVSSLFYSFKGMGSSNSNSRGNTPLVSIKPLSTPPAGPSSENEILISTDKPKTKPALLAKPKLPVKRSKSLKLFGKAVEAQEELSPSVKPNRDTKGALVDIDKKVSPLSKPGSKSKKPSSSDTGFTSVTSNPIKVCVKQVELPKMQAIVSKSVKQEAQTATTYEGNGQSQNHKKSNGDLDIKRASNDQGQQGGLKPIKSHETSNGSPKGGTSPSRIKMGMAKEMEDVFFNKGSTPTKNSNMLKKYDTVTPKSLAAMTSGTSLTRSQSHVWQQTKVELPPVRIFSDENIFFNSVGATGPFLRDNTPRLEKDKLAPKRNEHFESQEGGSGFKNNSFFDEDFRLAHSRENPTARRRVPKTNPYTNYSPSVTNTKDNSSSKPQITKQNSHGRDKYVGSVRSKGESEGRDLPSLRSSHTRSRENSSESSSTTGTPRSSLPSTPTQTLDPCFSNLIKGSSVANGVKRVKASGNPPKSILKGSLSSTPSESDERLELSNRYVMSQPSNPSLANSVTASAAHKMNTIRIAVGVRERRNSFRQAVWKEEQPLVNGNSVTNYQESPKNTHIFSQKGQNGLGDSPTGPSSRPVVRSHKDYEPIWPEPHDNPQNNHHTFRIEPNSFYVSIEDRNTNPTANFNRGLVNGNQIGRGGSSKDPSPYSSKESTPFGTQEKYPFREPKPSYLPVSGNRYEEIKVLLEELKAPPVAKVGMVTSAPSSNDFSMQLIKAPLGDFPSRNMGKSSTTSSSLKHQRSLRAPSRPQYQQGLSCFTFKKPSSLESITDQLHAAESYAGFNSKDLSSAYGRGERQCTPSGEGPPPKGRHVNDYVSLRQCYTAAATTTNPYGVQNGDRQLLCDRNDDSSTSKTPIPPPRTKRAQQNARKNSQDAAETKPPPTASSSGIWLSNGSIGGKAGGPTQSTNLPEVVRCAKYNQDNHFTTDIPPDNANPTSPKAIIRALGVFQAKAANMRSRFAHWTESKERNTPKRFSDEDSIFPRDANEEKNHDGGFSSSVTSATQLPCPSRSKHQYL